MKNLKPEKVFYFFEEICKIPHVSFHTDRIRDYVEKFAVERGFRYVKDESGNIVIYKEASEGYESHNAVIIQGHLDMVGAKEENSPHNFLNDPIIIDENALEQGIITARGTTLGADDGIAVAYALAILDDDSLAHPPLEVVFTTNEEVGLLGATDFDCSLLSGRVMLNIDSEEEGVFLMGSAGGMRLDVSIPTETVPVVSEMVTITISGLKGGHSGDKIGTGRPSANVLIGRVLGVVDDKYEVNLISVNGGVVDNAISEKCVAKLTVKDAEGLETLCDELQNILKKEYRGIEDNISVLVEFSGKYSGNAIDKNGFKKLLMALKSMPQGVTARNQEDLSLVETSLNLGIIKVDAEGIKMGYSIRSSVESAKYELADRLRYITEYLGGTVNISGIYPAWTYNPVSRVREIIGEIYKEQTGKEPVMKTIHAGLECGIFYNRIPGLDIVSYGPDIYDIHTYDERMEVKSVQRVYELTKELLRRL